MTSRLRFSYHCGSFEVATSIIRRDFNVVLMSSFDVAEAFILS